LPAATLTKPEFGGGGVQSGPPPLQAANPTIVPASLGKEAIIPSAERSGPVHSQIRFRGVIVFLDMPLP
jgi:hypothetical protein